MNLKEVILLIIAVVSFILSVVVIIISQTGVRRTYRCMNEMLDDAIAGDFIEKKFDESQMSKVAAKLRRFLLSSKLSQNRINQEKEAIKSLISDISHQTKTPITNILLYLQLLSEEEQLPAGCLEQLELIKKQSEKLDFLVQALVKTSRLETGVIAVKAVNGVLNTVISSALEQLQGKAEHKNIMLKVCTEREYRAFFDLKWTIEAVYNVLDNAVKYTSEGGCITITLIEYEMFLRMDIEDNGIGIPEDELNKIFIRFYRGRETYTQEGVGIGLYLTRKILSEQGGYIKVASTQGKGSTFSLFFPRKA